MKSDGVHLEDLPSFHGYNSIDTSIGMPKQHARFKEAATSVSEAT